MSSANDMKLKGNECLTKKDFEGAVEWYSKGIQIDPNNHILYSNRSAAYLSMNNFISALEDAEKCIALNPSWDKGYSRKFAVLEAMRDLNGCEDILNKGIYYLYT